MSHRHLRKLIVMNVSWCHSVFQFNDLFMSSLVISIPVQFKFVELHPSYRYNSFLGKRIDLFASLRSGEATPNDAFLSIALGLALIASSPPGH